MTAGAYGDPFHAALGGLIVGFGGAISMAIGSYISVKSQKEVRESRILAKRGLSPEL